MVLGCGPDVRAGSSVWCSGRWRPGRGPGQGDGVLSPTAFLPWDQPCRLRQDSLHMPSQGRASSSPDPRDAARTATGGLTCDVPVGRLVRRRPCPALTRWLPSLTR